MPASPRPYVEQKVTGAGLSSDRSGICVGMGLAAAVNFHRPAMSYMTKVGKYVVCQLSRHQEVRLHENRRDKKR
ncbi:hypothetical protein KCP73_11700 [Salmonella enterica subsp. enterica]|nr:hypothetical protein KCP73_11700 [Salmonella enterica subsp. enterica]